MMATETISIRDAEWVDLTPTMTIGRYWVQTQDGSKLGQVEVYPDPTGDYWEARNNVDLQCVGRFRDRLDAIVRVLRVAQAYELLAMAKAQAESDDIIEMA